MSGSPIPTKTPPTLKLGGVLARWQQWNSQRPNASKHGLLIDVIKEFVVARGCYAILDSEIAYSTLDGNQ